MHDINRMRLAAGIPMDMKYEQRDYGKEQLTEARDVPMKRHELAPKDEKTMRAHVQGVSKAVAHLRNAVKALEKIPAVDFNADIPRAIREIEDLIYDDGGESGLAALITAYTERLNAMKSTKVDEDVEQVNEKSEEDATVKTSELNDEVKESMCSYEREEEEEDYNASHTFKKGETVLYDNGVWIVHVADDSADMVGVIPPSMKKASPEEKAKAMQQVKRDKLRKPSQEEEECMAGPDGVLGTADDIRMESTNNYTKSNALSHDDTDESPVNVVPQTKGDWANSLNPEYVKDEYPAQLDQRGDQSMDDYANKVKVPAKVKSALKDAIKEFEKDAKRFGNTQSDQEAMNFYVDAAEAFKDIDQYLQAGTINDIKKAQHYAASLMGPMLHKLPDVVWDFLSHGGQKRSLKDYMNAVPKPMMGPESGNRSGA